MGLFKRRGCEVWQMRFFHNGKMIYASSKTKNRRLAQTKLDAIKTEIAQGKFHFVGKENQITFSDYSQLFLEWIKIHRKDSTWRRYKSSIAILTPYFGKQKLTKIQKSDLEKYKSSRVPVVEGATINRDLACFKKLFNRAIADGYCQNNPVNGIEFFREPLKAIEYLSEDEASKLIAACDEVPIKSFVILGLNTGMRLEELLSLSWENISFEDRTIVLDETKRGRDDTIPMNETVFELLLKQAKTSGYVISKSNGERYKDIRKPWNRILKKSGIKRCTPHILRHTFATTLVREGADLMAVKELGRWSELKLLERYAHVAKDHRTRVIALLDGKFGGVALGGAIDKNEDKSDTDK